MKRDKPLKRESDPNSLLPLLLAFADSAVTLLKLPVIGYTSSLQPFPFGVPSYPTISTDLDASYDLHLHILICNKVYISQNQCHVVNQYSI